MNIRIDVERAVAVATPRAQVLAQLMNLEGTLKCFPKLRKLHALGVQDYRLDMHTIGSSIARIAHDVSFGARCALDAAEGELSWTPLPKVGNAQLEGLLKLRPDGAGSRLSLRVHGELAEVPVPLMYRLVAPAFIQGKFAALVDAYLEKIGATAAGAPARASV
ncbi:MAG: hypothetical protein ACT4QA_14265 [Panacagrimonas sp.]